MTRFGRVGLCQSPSASNDIHRESTCYDTVLPSTTHEEKRGLVTRVDTVIAPTHESTACTRCPLRSVELFHPRSSADIAEIARYKQREVRLSAGQLLIHEGQASDRIYTLLDGWAYRFRTLADGRRQILQFLLAGDLAGAQQAIVGNAWHGVRTLTEATFCVFGPELVRHQLLGVHNLGGDISVLLAHECSALEEHLMNLGQRSALERMASLLLTTFRRAASLQPDRSASGVFFPATQQDIADTLGLSLVHTNKTMRRLERLTGCSLSRGWLRVSDPKALSRIANLYSDGRPARRPLI